MIILIISMTKEEKVKDLEKETIPTKVEEKRKKTKSHKGIIDRNKSASIATNFVKTSENQELIDINIKNAFNKTFKKVMQSTLSESND